VTASPASAAIQGFHWTAALQQTPATPSDSVRVESPLPGGVAEVARFLLNTVPPWLQIAGVVIAVIVAGLVVWFLVRHRRAIREWLASRRRAVQLALAAGALALTAAVVGTGTATWDYTQHSNDFCTGCHVMAPAFQKFGNAENKHGELSCHACHQQSVIASARQVYLWIAERPDRIPAHAKVANRVCETCHVTGDTAKWQRIAATAGHRVHLESDSSALKNVQCVTCHGVEVHRFRPVSATCGQSGCHEQKETNIVLGKMATQTVRHCTSCHAFTADVPALATRDSARGTLVPGQAECLGCHEMRRVLGDFDASKEPHRGSCGTCHNPHEQTTPAAAAASCATASCHANWRDEPFHVGASHKRVAERCLTCHAPHSSRVDASDCVGCHASVRSRGPLRPPLPFDTTSALKRVSQMERLGSDSNFIIAAHRVAESTSRSDPSFIVRTAIECCHSNPTPILPTATGPSADADLASESDDAPRPGGPAASAREPPIRFRAPWPPPSTADSFPHARHATLACLVCHQTGTGHGRLTFERPRGCAICHHQAPTSARCPSCHHPEKYATPKSVTVTVTVPGHAPKQRPVNFLHERHASRQCVECHTTPVTLAPAPAKAECKDCHSEHHGVNRTCSSCHTIADPRAAHTTLQIHQRCDACHTPTTVARLTPTRSLCATCHPQKATNHYDQKECSACHFLAEPAVYRSKLTTRSP
jgi:hypothetical protein